MTEYDLRTRCSARVGIHRCIRRGRFLMSYDDGTWVSPLQTWFCHQHSAAGRTVEFYVDPELWPWPKHGAELNVVRRTAEVTWLTPWRLEQPRLLDL